MDWGLKLYTAGIVASFTTLPWGKLPHPWRALIATLGWPITVLYFLCGHQQRVVRWLET